MIQNLEYKYLNAIEKNFISTEIPNHITDNLNPKFEIRPYQQEAFKRFIYHSEKSKSNIIPSQFLFHMATGSGKTLVMAGCILHLYALGYRNFIFFVNSTSIINKTKDNFLNSLSSKYLFAQSLAVFNKKIEIKEVDNFEKFNDDAINIVFTTIQGLHTKLNLPRENNLNFEDFEDKKIILLSDEAHHINAETKKGKQTQDEFNDQLSWENTVAKIFKANSENYLLEFTATADLENPEISSKYNDKILFDYSLKQFRNDKFSKEVKVLQAELNPFERALQAIILSQYRKKIFEKNSVFIKPVVLFKSKTIVDSQAFFIEFNSKIKNLSTSIIEKINANSNTSVLKKAFNYFKNNNISFENLLFELQEEFSISKCITVDSKNDSDEKQLIINSLEDKNNEYRAVFAVDKLNEGWDVLNLFDIVKLYETRNSNSKKGTIGKTTMSEAQLIGRGARYCPFKINESDDFYKRKYDSDYDNELRIGEELYYHSAYNPSYISELSRALEHLGIKSSKTIEKKLFLKETFKKTNFYSNGSIYLNSKVANDRKKYTALDLAIRTKIYKYSISFGNLYENTIFISEPENHNKKKTKEIYLKDLGEVIIRKALHKLPFFKFDNLQNYFPSLQSISEFISSENYLGKIKLVISGSHDYLDTLTINEKLDVILKILKDIQIQIALYSNDYEGSETFNPHSISKIFKDKNISIDIDDDLDGKGIGQKEVLDNELFLDIAAPENNWYVFNENYGTSQEKKLVNTIKILHDDLKNDFDEIYLFQNANYFKTYSYENGESVIPEFVLFLIKIKQSKIIVYQLFINIKNRKKIGTNNFKFKENLLSKIQNNFVIEILYENETQKLYNLTLL